MTIVDVECRIGDDDGQHALFKIRGSESGPWIECESSKGTLLAAVQLDYDTMISFLKVSLAIVEMEKRRHNG